MAACLAFVGCGNTVVEQIGAPTISAVLPQTIAAGSSTVTMKVTGSNFTSNAVILWNGSKLATSVVDTTTLSGSIQGGSLMVPGTAQLQVQNSQTGESSQVVPVSIVSSGTNVPLPLAIGGTALASGVMGTAYSASLSATGGTPGYTWSVVSGSLPGGLTLAAGTGAISGTPSASGTFSFTVQVSDSSNPVQTQTAAVSITVAPTPVAPVQLTIATSSLVAGTDGAAYTQTLLATGGTPGYTWSITAGTLPAGLTLAAGTGVISGTPTVSGTFSFTATVNDSSNPVQTRSAVLSITVAPTQLEVTPASLPAGTDGTAYTQTLHASGGTPGYTWSISSGSLPTGLTLAAGSGVISGKPTASGTFNFMVTVHDSSSPVQTKSVAFSITIAAVGSPLTIGNTSLLTATDGATYTQTLQASGGTPGYTWSITAGSLPAGLTLAAGTGVISGTPTASGTFSFTATVSDSSSPVQTKSAALSISVTTSQLSIVTTSLAAGTDGAAYSQTLHASGGTPGYTWAIATGGLPTGLTLAAGGTISGTPTAGGTFVFSVTVSDSSSTQQKRSANLSITIAATPLAITSSTLAAATEGTAYTQTLTASGGTLPYTWSITSGSLPTGLALSSGGVISGTPTASGTYKVTVAVSDSSNPAQTQSAATSIIVAAEVIAGPGKTWFVRPDGGTRYSAGVPTGQCNGTSDAAYQGTGVDQNCAFNDVRYLWSDNSGAQNAWVIAGGDTVVIRGCAALASQTNASNPDCRLGYDNATNGNAPNFWCGYGNGNDTCFNPPIPAGTAAQPTRILGGCAYGTYSCTPINNKYPYGPTNETQLFGGFGLTWAFNLEGTSYVTIEGIELTTHNGACTSGGAPSYPRGCSSSVPYDDFAANGFLFNTTSANIVLQDVYIHGFNSSGLYGPIGGQVSLTRVFSGFNAFAGWNFDDGSGTPDATGAGIMASYVTMMFNGCYEQYPITATYPAQVCYDTNSGGFGDSWSGQGVGTESVLTAFTCDHCVDDYNTKDGFIGPHIAIPNLTITNSVAIGNMGANWKWGGEDSVPSTVTFQNNLTVSNCTRMDAPMTGVPSTYNMYLTGFCRAGGNGAAVVIPIGSTWNIQNNTFITAQQIAWYVACVAGDNTCPSTINSTNNVFLGYRDPNNPYGNNVPTLYYLSAGIVLNASHNDEFGMQDGSCPSTTNGMICSDPQLLNEPAQPWVSESALDVFNPFVAGNSFYPSSSSPVLSGGVQIPGLTTDYYGVTRPTPPSLGAVVYAPAP
jgi:Putative Ig domain